MEVVVRGEGEVAEGGGVGGGPRRENRLRMGEGEKKGQIFIMDQQL